MVTGTLTADVTVGAVPLTVNFELEITSGVPAIVTWQFGDGETYSNFDTVKVSHIYETYGVHTVIVTVEDEVGDTTVFRETDFIKIAKLDFEIVPKDEGLRPLQVQFINKSIAPSGLSFSGWEWDFGDGSDTSDEESPSHLYEIVGSFNVTLDAELS